VTGERSLEVETTEYEVIAAAESERDRILGETLC